MTDIKERIKNAMFSGMTMSLRDDLCDMLDEMWMELASKDEEISSLLERLAVPPVKQLEWDTHVNPRAKTVIGDYVILKWARGPQVTLNRGATQIVIKDCDTTREAKEVAQSHFEQTILEQLREAAE